MRYAWLILAAGLLTACGDKNKNDAETAVDPTPTLLRQLSDACQKIDKRDPAVCDCRSGVFASNLTPDELSAFSEYRTQWAANVSYPEAEKQARIAAAAVLKIDPKKLDDIIGKAVALAPRLDACQSRAAPAQP